MNTQPLSDGAKQFEFCGVETSVEQFRRLE